MIPLHLIKTITEEFSEKNRLGKGGYGEVYKGVLNVEEIAVKKLFPVHGLDEEAFTNEFRNLMTVQHKNIVRLIGYCYEIAHKHVDYGGQLVFAKVIDRALCFEYMHQGSLSEHLSAESCIHDWPTTYRIIKGTCEALDYLHRGRGENNYIYHLDLKPDNILLDKNMVPKVGDFGLSRLFGDSATQQTGTAKGTLGFMPPEYIARRLMTPKNDVFSLGVIIFHMMAGEKGYGDYCDLRTRQELPEKCQRFIEGVQEYWTKTMQANVGYTLTDTDLQGVTMCIEIAIRCVDVDRDKRPSTREIIDELAKLNDQIAKMPKTSTRPNMSGPTMAAHPGRGALDVVIVYAFDCTTSTPDWYKVGDVYTMVQEKLAHFVDSCLGFIYVMSTPNTYTSDISFVDSSKTESSARKRDTCTKNMASGLPEAHKMMRDRSDSNGIILLFSDGMVNKGDFFDGAEDFISTVPVHTFTLGGDAYNYGLQSIATNSPGGTFVPHPVPDKPIISVPFSRQLDSILGGTTNDDEMHSSLNSGMLPVDVVIVYAFDCTTSTPAWYTVNDVYTLVQGKLSQVADSCLGFTYVMSTPNTYKSDMNLVESLETGNTSSSARSTDTCMKNMASGLTDAHKMIGYRGHSNSIILLFSDGLINKGDYFDGAEEFISRVPVHTFTLGGDEYNYGLRAMARNSPGGVFSPLPVPNKPSQSVAFSRLLDSILSNTTKDGEKHGSPNSGRWPLDVVIVYAFDCTTSTQDWEKVNYVYALVQEKLTDLADSRCLGFIYGMSTPNTYVSDITLVDTSNTGYTRSSARSNATCMKNMASGLPEAHRLMSDHGNLNGIILLFSDGLINRGDFFDGAEDFISKVPVHTFTLGGDAYNHGLRTIASNSPGGTFSPIPVTDRPNLSVPFLRRLDSILNGTIPDSGKWPLDVVIVYAFDSTTSTPAWVTVGDVYAMVQGKLLHCVESCIGFTYVELTPNTCTSDMNLVHSMVMTGYEHGWARSRITCTKNMASGLPEAHKLISYRGHCNSKILLFSDGLINKGDFFDGAEDYISKVPVHTFTLGGDAYNHVLRSMADNSPGGKFHPIPIPDKPILSEDFSKLLDSILGETP